MSFKRFLVAAAAAFGLCLSGSGHAAGNLSVTPITWDVIGLDSNSPATGPRYFPVGARVCSSAPTSNVTVNFIWDSVNANINLRTGSSPSITIASLAAGACADAYFETEVNQVAAAYDTARKYHISATDASGTASTPMPRQLYVEHLISQNRNAITGIKLDGASIPAGGAMNLVVGNTYTIELDGGTATQGYEQFEAFINFPNTIFQVLSVNTTYSANTSVYVTSPNDKLYADACRWENDPTNPNYRACVGISGKAGGSNVVTTYVVKILGGGGTSQPLNTLLYDFSGSSFHYNADFSAGARIANIIDPTTSVNFAKAFSPSSTVAGGTSTLSFTIANTAASAVSGINFVDNLPNLPAQMVVASPVSYSTSGCGAPTFAPVAGSSLISFANGSIAGNSTCVVTVAVSVPPAPTTGTYTNTSNHLFVGGIDTGKSATANLTLASTASGSGVCGATMAQWTFAGSSTSPSTKAADVGTAAISGGNGLGSVIDTTSSGGNPQPGLASYGWLKTTPIDTATSPYLQFAIDTSKYSNVKLRFDAQRKSNGPDTDALYYSTDGTTWTLKSGFTATTAWTTYGAPYDFTGQTSTTGVTYFRIYGNGANSTSQGNDLTVDNVTFSGCGSPGNPTLTKAFAATTVPVNGSSTLTFTLTNPNAVQLTGAKFNDPLPAGLEVAAVPNASTTCGGSPTWTPVAGATTLDFGQVAGATIPASGSCTVSVNVKATSSGPHTNVSGFISTNEGGTNSSASGSATASLTALIPPSISEVFGTNPVRAGNSSLLSFTITNPNASDTLSGVSFSDSYPSGLLNASPLSPAVTNTCGGSVAAVAGGSSITLSGGTLAPGATCTVSVPVTAAVPGSYVNTSGAVAANIAGSGNTASATLTVTAPQPSLSLLKQIGTGATGPWSRFVAVAPGTPVYYRLTVENTGDVPFSPVSVTDPKVSTASCAWPATLAVASPTQDPSASCVIGPVNTLAGDNPNTASASGTYGGNNYAATPSTADYIGAPPGFSLLKQAGSTASGPWSSSLNVALGADVFYKFTLVNTSAVPLSPVSVSDPQLNDASSCVFSDTLGVGGATTCVVGPVTASSVAGTFTNTATGHGSNGGVPADTAPSSADYIAGSTPPDLTIAKSHSGNFSQGQTNAQYSIVVSNTGGDKTAGNQVSVTDTAPGGLTITAMSGTGWTCTTLPTCTRTDSLAAGASYPAITVTVTVAANAATPLINSASVTLTGQTESSTNNNTVTDSTIIVQLPDLTIAKSHSGNFNQGQTNAQYGVTVSNGGSGDKTAGNLVSVTDTAPAGMTVTAMNGPGWTCTTLPTCTRSDVLAAGASYPPIAVTVSVAANAASPLSNTVSVALAGQAESNTGNNSTADSTVIVASGSVCPGNEADVKTSISAPTTGNVGTPVNVLINFSNTGVASATGVTYGATLTGNVASVSCAGATCSYNSGTGVVTITGLPASLTPGQNIGITLSYTPQAAGSVSVASSIGTNSCQGANFDPDTAIRATTVSLAVTGIPTLSPAGLAVLMLMMAALGLKYRKNGR